MAPDTATPTVVRTGGDRRTVRFVTGDYRATIIDEVWQRARTADSAMLRVLSRGEVEWLLDPLWAVDVTDEPDEAVSLRRETLEVRHG